MKKLYPLSMLFLLICGSIFVACESTNPQTFSASAKTFKITHQGDEFSIAIGTTDIADTSWRVAPIGTTDIVDTASRVKPIGTTDIVDTASVAIGTTDIVDTASVHIGTTDIADMGGIITLQDNSILSLSYNGTTFSLTTIASLPSDATKQHCYPLSANIIAKDGKVIVKVAGQPNVNYTVGSNVLFIVIEGGEICIYLRTRS